MNTKLAEITRYACDTGDITLMRDGAQYSVLQRKYSPEHGVCVSKCRVYNFIDYELALDKYKDLIEILNGRRPINMCTCKSRRQKCSAKNCPTKLGGPAFWQMFRDACLYKSR